MKLYQVEATAGMGFREALATVSDQMQVGDQIRVSWPDGLRETGHVMAESSGVAVQPEWLETIP